MNYRKINNIAGWVTGAIALFVYLKTMEPTASFWDCGEFLSCAYKIEVGHSPGAPFFMLLQRFFGLFSGGGALTAQPSHNAAWFINSLSAVTSALSILFLFWTITHFAKKLITDKNEEPNSNQTLAIIGAGLVGALAYTFSDTFWFSAVEAEVYGTSSFFTAITFWAILKWENVADNKYSDRWLILIAYLIGISVCVHLLNLLTIPALAMVYYYKRYEATTMGSIIAFIVGCVVLAFVQFGVIQYIPKLASAFDIFFTNSLGLPFDVGSITLLVLVIGLLVWLTFFAKRTGRYLLHTATLCILFIIIGYSSYLVAIIRSRADVPIDMTNPDNAFSFLDYVDREQFGQQPLVYGPDFTSTPSDIVKTGSIYSQTKHNGKDQYEVVGTKLEPVYDASQKRFFPRIYDNNEQAHIQFYREFLGLNKGDQPTTSDNFKYFFGYQMNWMWWRYFMWNYAGRQNDFEGQGDPQNGNWISGIKFVDNNIRGLGDADKMGKGYSDNEARNQLYFLPMILGLLGLVFQFNRNKKDGIVVAVLFFFTGAAIGIYLNMPPLQPRERDYAFAGCTYTFAIWIGLGVLMVNDWMKRVTKGQMATYLTIALCILLVPVLMASQEWNDHDRSRKTLAEAVAYNTLNSCAPNAVLFTYGDNQTYPLWYLQEVEGMRRDVRIINTSLLGIDWYVDQLNYKVNDADAVPMEWKKEAYVGDRRNYIRFYPNAPQVQQDKYYNIKEVCDFINNDANKVALANGESDVYLPTKKLFAPTMSKEELVKRGLINAADTARISTEMKFNFPKDVALKSDLAVMNIVAAVSAAGWNRPLYFDAGLRQGDYAGMADYMRMEGVLYRLMPYKYNDSVKINPQVYGTVDADKSYNLFMNKYVWGGAERNDVYFDEPNRHELITYRMDASFVANALIAQGQKQKAEALLDHVLKNITEHSYSYDYSAYFIAASYYRAGAVKKGADLTRKVVRNAEDNINWALSLPDDGKAAMAGDMRQNWEVMGSLGNVAMTSGDSTTAKDINGKMQSLMPKLAPILNAQGGGQQ
jgi:hypothetical protein